MGLKNVFGDIALEKTQAELLLVTQVDVKILLQEILVQLKITNRHYEMMLENELTEEDIRK